MEYDQDKELIDYYMIGFNDELTGKTRVVHEDLLKAYKLGADHAILGDDISSFDLLTSEEVLKMIKE